MPRHGYHIGKLGLLDPANFTLDPLAEPLADASTEIAATRSGSVLVERRVGGLTESQKRIGQ